MPSSSRPHLDEFAHSRLPDLPIDGYASFRQKELTDAIMYFLRATERDRLALLDMVCQGPHKFRHVAGTAWRAFGVDTDLVDAVFGYLVLLAGVHPQAQRDALLHGQGFAGSWRS